MNANIDNAWFWQARIWGSDTPSAAPFRALKVVGAIYHMQGGLQIDGAARVLHADGWARGYGSLNTSSRTPHGVIAAAASARP